MSNSFYHKNLTDGQWNRIKFLFEEPAKVGRPPLNTRRVFNAIMWMLKSGARWRDLPARYGNWNSIYHKFRLWCKRSLFDRLLKFINGDAKETTFLELDSTFCFRPSECVFGFERPSNRGVARRQKYQDSGIELGGKKILADKAYSCEQIRSFSAEHGAVACIPDKAHFKIKHDFNPELYKQHTLIERFFQRIKNYRHVATRYDKLALCFENFFLLAASLIHF